MACLTLVCCCAAMHAPFAFRWGGSVDDWKFIIMDIIGIETGVSILVGRGPFAFESPHKELPSQ